MSGQYDVGDIPTRLITLGQRVTALAYSAEDDHEAVASGSATGTASEEARARVWAYLGILKEIGPELLRIGERLDSVPRVPSETVRN